MLSFLISILISNLSFVSAGLAFLTKEILTAPYFSARVILKSFEIFFHFVRKEIQINDLDQP